MASMDLTNEVVRLRAELEKVSAERDMLLCEVSNLRRELELSELKHLQDDRCTHCHDLYISDLDTDFEPSALA
ncbi:hypothetical protein EVAR_884_1 [Eumeta japonica]|uniref:Uncharacterized protein n=1 Tax=Eumeta variegata TaxID=151549 RepID=A0A4C1SDN3_EUMVA|nr:hypothetical protein EVAR_884_1 [Eumeta japonica]